MLWLKEGMGEDGRLDRKEKEILEYISGKGIDFDRRKKETNGRERLEKMKEFL